jgi:[ribosomal protein S18]-alanine N-acetyltransferase
VTIPTIRVAASTDVSALIALVHSSATAAHWSEDHYHSAVAQIADGTRLVLIAEESDSEGKRIIGFLVAAQVPPEWELENVVVAASERRKGFGKRLVEAFLERARETDSEAVFLEVRESNQAARALYQAVGFQQVGRRRSYYAAPAEDAVLYRRILF